MTEIMIRNVPEDLRRALKIRAAQEGKTMQRVLLEMLQKYLAGESNG